MVFELSVKLNLVLYAKIWRAVYLQLQPTICAMIHIHGVTIMFNYSNTFACDKNSESIIIFSFLFLRTYVHDTH